MEENTKSSFWPKFSFLSGLQILVLFVFLANFGPMVFQNLVEMVGSFGQKKILTFLLEIGSPDLSMVSGDGEITCSQVYANQIKKASLDDKIKIILIKINSPGGYAASSELIANEIALAREKKPVIAFVENLCASGAYWIASACNKIICPETALVGSIGVISSSYNLRSLAERFDVKPTILRAGKYKAVGHPFAPQIEPWEIKYREGIAMEIYKIFYQAVAKNRKLSVNDLANWADGKIFTGKKAFELGLVDQIGGMNEVETTIRELAGADGKIMFIKTPKPSRLSKLLGGGDDQCSVFSMTMPINLGSSKLSHSINHALPDFKA